MALISNLKTPDDQSFGIRAGAIQYGEVDSTSTSTVYTATVPGITELADGTTVLLRNGVVTSAANFTININGLGAKPSYSNMALGNEHTPTSPTRDTTIFNINYAMIFVYSSTIVNGGAWICYRGYDANTNTIGYQLRSNSFSLPMDSIVYRYRLLFQSADNTKWVPANNSTSTNATAARTVCQSKINPFGAIVYYGTTASVAAGSRPSTSYLWQQYAFTLGYSFQKSPNYSLTSWKPVYLKCAPQTDGSAIIDADVPFVQDLPSTEDGKIYILLGYAYSTTAMELVYYHPVYHYKDGMIRLYTTAQTGGGASYTATSPIVISNDDISHADSGVTAGSKGDSSAQTPAFGGTFKALSGTVDAKGHLTAFDEHNVTIPSNTATQSVAGLMSAADKTKLDGLSNDITTLYLSKRGTNYWVYLVTYNGNVASGFTFAEFKALYESTEAIRIIAEADVSPAGGAEFKVQSIDTVNEVVNLVSVKPISAEQHYQENPSLFSLVLKYAQTYTPNSLAGGIMKTELYDLPATNTRAGIMSAQDAEKLNGIQDNAQRNFEIDVSGTLAYDDREIFKLAVVNSSPLTGVQIVAIAYEDNDDIAYVSVPTEQGIRTAMTGVLDDYATSTANSWLLAVNGSTASLTNNASEAVNFYTCYTALSMEAKTVIVQWLSQYDARQYTPVYLNAVTSTVIFTCIENGVLHIVSLSDTAPDITGTGLVGTYRSITIPTASSTAPSMDGTASAGSSANYARADHVHPTDTSRQATLVSGTNIKTVGGTSVLGSGDIALPTKTSDLTNDSGFVTSDTKVTQTVTTTTDYTYWRGLCVGSSSSQAETGSLSTTTDQVRIFSNIRVQPSTGTLKATTFKGQLSGTIASSTTATTQASTDNSTKVATTAFVKSVLPAGLPSVSSSDNGKVLMVVNGAWAAASLPVYNGGVI